MKEFILNSLLPLFFFLAAVGIIAFAFLPAILGSWISGPELNPWWIIGNVFWTLIIAGILL